MRPTRKPGTFVWPPRDDIQQVKPEFIIDSGIVPECLSSGRQWFFSDHVKHQELYDNYKEIFLM